MDTSPTFSQQPQKQPRLVGGTGIAGLYLWLAYVLVFLLFLLAAVVPELRRYFLRFGDLIIFQFVVLILGFLLMCIDARRRRTPGKWIAILGVVVLTMLAIMWLLMSMYSDKFDRDLQEFASIFFGVGIFIVYTLKFCVLGNVMCRGRRPGFSTFAWFGLASYVMFTASFILYNVGNLGYQMREVLDVVLWVFFGAFTIASLVSIFLCLFLRRGVEPTVQPLVLPIHPETRRELDMRLINGEISQQEYQQLLDQISRQHQPGQVNQHGS